MNIAPELITALRESRSVVVLSGAGVSAPSGIPTFRDAMTGLWAKFDPSQLATPEAFEADPALVSRWYDQRRCQSLRCRPNAAHAALVQIERSVTGRGGRLTLLTQNVDRLHQRAGSRNVHELHGSLIVWRCTKTGREVEFSNPAPFERYPRPSEHGGLLRPGVVWFGESLPESAMAAAEEALNDCDLFFSIGTSSVVYPAAGFIATARRRGARTCEINLTPTPISDDVDWAIHAGCDAALTELVQRMNQA